MIKKQNVRIDMKLGLRRRTSKYWDDGYIYVPYCGEGDIASSVYDPNRCLLADIDEDKVSVAKERNEWHGIAVSDVEKTYPFGSESITVADFDSWSYPYDALRVFIDNAVIGNNIIMYFTDGQRQSISRKGKYKTTSGDDMIVSPDISRDKYKKYWLTDVVPMIEWISERICKKCVHKEKYLRHHMIYYCAAFGDYGEVVEEENHGDHHQMIRALREAAMSGNVPAITKYIELIEDRESIAAKSHGSL